MTKSDIQSIIETQKQELGCFGLQRIGIFGSSVRGEATDTSDVDVILDFDQTKKTYQNFIKSTFFLEKLLGRSVDAVTPQGLSPYIKPYIDREITYVQISD
ncbi:MAG: nucleotidyltransferase family protein [Candidatus Gottesmanbacteria bacterium]|nr:nucleotidyltransferase family protein [Candidatus Gottesmanbacteria bacterium]